jgi:hypothetical protein
LGSTEKLAAVLVQVMIALGALWILAVIIV